MEPTSDSARGRKILSIKGITKRFEAITALRQVNLELRAGVGHALAGENGAGKSTLIKIISGQIPPDAGSIVVEGEEVVFRSAADAQQAGISVVPQEASLVREMSVAENIFLGNFPVRLGHLDSKTLIRRSQDILRRLGLQIDPRERAATFSPGLQRLIEIARGLSKDARIFILDEPTAALTELEAEHMFRILDDLKNAGCAILYVSHRMREISQIAEDVTVLRDGAVTRSWVGEKFSEDEIVHAMVGRSIQLLDKPERRPGRQPEALRVEKLNRRGALRNVSFEVARGEIVALSGLMGSGRTEILRAIFGIDRLDSGHIFVAGEKTSISDVPDAIRAGIALVPEERKAQGIVEMMSIADNISLPYLRRWAHANFLDDRTRGREISQIATRVGLKFGSFADPINSLSGGNQQKVVFAKWLCHPPRIFLLDEPTRGIDVGAKFEVYTLIRRLAEDGCAVLLVSSELPEVLSLADRILVVREGEIVGELDSSEANEHALIELAMWGATKPNTPIPTQPDAMPAATKRWNEG